ncbi:MAG: HEAT repeat domain-containing protein [Pseudomonadota bacterium]
MSSPEWRRAAVAALVIVVLGAVTWVWRGDYRPSLSPTSPISEDALELTWREGHRQQYQVEVESDFEMSMAGTGGQAMTLSIAAILDQETLSVEPETITSGMRFSQFQLSISGASDPAVNRALQLPFRVIFSPQGQPLNFEFPAEMAAEHRDVLQNLIGMFQAVLNNGDRWETLETNASGKYAASYSRTSAQTLVKQKLRYLSDPQFAAPSNVESRESIDVDPQNDWITSMVLQEVLVTDQAGAPPTRVENTARIALLEAATPGDTEQWAFTATPAQTEPEDLDAELLALSLEQATGRLEATISQLNDAQEGRNTLIYQVRDLLLSNDELPSMLLDIMRLEDLTTHTRADLYLAFELAGTPAAQSTLNIIALDPAWPPEDAIRAIVALAGVANPTADTLNSLWNLARSNLADTQRRDLPGTAALAIGSLGDELRESEPGSYSALRNDLLASAQSASLPSERTVFLYALGNTKDPDPSLQQDLLPFLEDPSSQVRGAAAKTLSTLGANEVGPQLMNRVQQEPSGPAKASMVEALASLEKPPEDALAWTRSSLSKEQDERTRYNMVVLLGQNLEGYPENRLALQQLLETDASKRVRQKAADYLY